MTRSFFLLIVSALAGLGSAAAQPEDERGTWAVVLENDFFFSTDRNYTNGLRLSYLSGTHPPDTLSEAAANIFAADRDKLRIRRGFAVGHQIYTPEDFEVAEPLPDQHPYAGYVYGEYASVLQQDHRVDVFTLQLGLVGPSAGGEYVQNNWHRMIGGDEAKGWDHQIGDELAVTLAYDRRQRWLLIGEDLPVRFDVTPNVGMTLGNVQTNVRAGLTMRLGNGLETGFGPPRIRPATAGAGYFTSSDRNSWYIFAGMQGRGVAHNIFLDGSFLDEGDPSVTSEPFVLDAQAGLVLNFNMMQVALTRAYQTTEFEEQDEGQRYGAISLSWKF